MGNQAEEVETDGKKEPFFEVYAPKEFHEHKITNAHKLEPYFKGFPYHNQSAVFDFNIFWCFMDSVLYNGNTMCTAY